MNTKKQLFWRSRNQLFGVLIACLIVWILTLSYSVELEILTTITDLLINQQWKHVPPPTNYSISFTEKCGIVEMQHSSVSIVGVGRNIAENFPRLVENIHTLCVQFNTSQAIFVEGDSSDNSWGVLQEWARKSPRNRHVISTNSSLTFEKYGVFKGMKLPREGRISEARNLVLHKLRRLPKTDYIIWVDMDVLGWDNKGVQDSFGRTQYWDAICAHGILLHGLYRDTYALRALDFNNNHHMFGHDHDLYNISKEQATINRRQYKIDKEGSLELMDVSRMRDTQGNDMLRPIQVDSCFGGLAIYKTSILPGCEYNHRYPFFPYMLDCEHVLFNECVARLHKARIMSNPNLKLWYGHTSVESIDWKKEAYNFFFN